MVPLTIAKPDQAAGAGASPWLTRASGDRVRCTRLASRWSADGRDQVQLLRYERVTPAGVADMIEREFHNRFWSQAQFRELLVAAGFEKISFLAPAGGRAEPDATSFIALARRSS